MKNIFLADRFASSALLTTETRAAPTNPFQRTFSPTPVDPSPLINVDRFRTMDDVRLQLIADCPTELSRVEAAICLTQGLSLMKQYDLAKSFLQQVQHEQLLPTNNHTFVNGSFVNELD